MNVLLLAAAAAGIISGIRYYLLKMSLRKTDRMLEEIRRDLDRNQILKLPVPDKELEHLLHTINHTLEDVRLLRRQYQKQEQEFKEQIENISHDLRTPLTVILGYMRLLKEKKTGELSGPELEEALELIERKSRYMQRLADQFYSFSRLTARDYELTVTAVDAGRLLKETLIGHYQVLEEAQLKVEAGLSDHPLWTDGDREALERIFSNLFQNAARYAKSFLRLYAAQEGQKTSFFFENDMKKELSNEDAEKLFDRFYVRDGAGNREGTGLGLTVAKYLAEAMGGTLTAVVVENGKRTENGQPCGEKILCFKLCLNAGHPD